MDQPRIRHRDPTPKTRWQLYAISGNICAWPGCSNPLFDVDYKATLLGEASHIKGQTDKSTRFDPKQTEEENRSIQNLIGMCAIHHKIIDSKENEADYPSAKLLEWKDTHERRVIDKADRSWIRPANVQIKQFIAEDGLLISATAHFWIDREGRPQIYDDRKLAVVNLLRELYLDIDRLSTLQKCVNENPEGQGKGFVQFGMKHHYKGSPIAHILRVRSSPRTAG